MDILVLTEFFFPDSVGGANKMAYCTACGLAQRGHRVGVLTRRLDDRALRMERVDGLTVARCELPQRPSAAGLWMVSQHVRRGIDRLRSVASVDFDIVIAHQPLIGLMARRDGKSTRIPWVYNFHSSWGEEYAIRLASHGLRGGARWRYRILRRMRDMIERRVLARSRRVIVLSEFMRRRLEVCHGPRRGVAVIPGGVDTEIFRTAEEKAAVRSRLGLPVEGSLLFTVRNLRRRMGLGNLLEAMAAVGGDPPPLLVVAGGGELENELRRKADALGVAGRVVFAGRVSEDRLPAYYQAADFFVLPTERLEGFGMVTAEALASGTPVIGTPVGATPELLGLVGREWLTRDSSAGALAEKMAERLRWMAERPEQYRDDCRLCREVALAHFAWPRIIDRWEDICREVARVPRASGKTQVGAGVHV